MSARLTGHVDSFAEDRLPAREEMPEFNHHFATAGYPVWLNAATHLLDRQVDASSDRRCVVGGDGRVWNYAEMRGAANRIARILVEDLRVVPGNRVLLRAPNSPMLAACWFAVLKAGAIAVTTMPLYRAGELRFMMEKAQVKHALCDARLRDELDRACQSYHGIRIAYFNEGGSSTPSLESLMRAKSSEFQNADTCAEDIAIIAFTSGTTGTPKAAMHYHRDLLAICDTYCARVLEPQSDDLFCGSPPLGFTFGLGGLLLFPLYAGAATLLLEKAGPAELLAAIAQFGATT